MTKSTAQPKSDNLADLANLRRTLIENSYRITAADGKRPLADNWQQTVLAIDEVADYTAHYSNQTNTGIVCANVIGIDIDAPDHDVCAELVVALSEIIPEAVDAPTRFGNRPKRLHLVRTAEPQPKTQSDAYMVAGVKCQVEFFGERSQFIAFGRHPDTGTAYEWINGSPLDVPVADLPLVTPEQLSAYREKVEEILAARGGELIKRGSRTAANDNRQAPVVTANGDGPWADVKARAFANLDAWVPALGLEGLKRYDAGFKSVASFRPSTSATRKRRERSLSIQPVGIFDHAPQQAYSPIDLVAVCVGLSPAEAVDWLKARVGGGEHEDGMKEYEAMASRFAASVKAKAAPEAANDNKTAGAPANDNQAATAAPQAISATPWELPDPRSIPPREWIYGHHYIRKFVSVTVSPGGVGKTSLGMGEALSMVTGRELFGVKVHQRARVWIWNGEDPKEELDRRLAAACIHYGIQAHEISGRIFVDSGRTMPLITARQTKDGAQIATPVVERLCEEISSKGIDVMIVDPFVSSHAITENDNMAMDAVVKQAWATIADRTNCSIDLVHHAKKMGGQEVTAESARGGVALIGAARAARVLNPMTADEANSANVENRRLHFRETDAKSNLAPPSEKSTWYRMHGHDLGNATNERPSDNVGVATLWKWPSATEGLKVSDLLAVQKVINAGSYKDSSQAANWAGKAVAEALDLDAETDKPRIKALLKEWKGSGALKTEYKLDENRKERPFVVVGEWAHNT